MLQQVDLKGMDKAVVLAALYNASVPQGFRLAHYNPKPMTVEEARELLKKETWFDCINGRDMMVDFSGDTLSTRIYNCDHGPGAAEKVINEAIQSQDVNNSEIQKMHREALRQSSKFL